MTDTNQFNPATLSPTTDAVPALTVPVDGSFGVAASPIVNTGIPQVQMGIPPGPVADLGPLAPSPFVGPAVSGPLKEASRVVDYRAYNGGRLSCTPPESKTVPNTGTGSNPPVAEMKYFQVPILYDYSTSGSKLLSDFYLDMPEVTSAYGISEKVHPSKNSEFSLQIKFNLADPEHIRMLDVFKQIHMGAAHIVYAYKGQLKFPGFSVDTPEATGLKSIVYYKIDPMTSLPLAGTAPSMFIKLFSSGTGQFKERTNFTLPFEAGQEPITVDWELLTRANIKIIPRIHIKRIYAGAKMSVQISMMSAIVTSMESRAFSNVQVGANASLVTSRPEVVSQAMSQFAKMEAERQDYLRSKQEEAKKKELEKEKPNAPTGPNNSPTFSGIGGQNPQAGGYQAPQGGNYQPPQGGVRAGLDANYQAPQGGYQQNPGQPQGTNYAQQAGYPPNQNPQFNQNPAGNQGAGYAPQVGYPANQNPQFNQGAPQAGYPANQNPQFNQGTPQAGYAPNPQAFGFGAGAGAGNFADGAPQRGFA